MTIEERAKTEYPDAFDVDNFLPIREGYLVVILRDAYIKGATEQKEIDDAVRKETQRQRDEYYDELLKLRSEKIAVINKVREFLEKALPSYIDIIDDIIDRDALIEQLCKAMEE